ncbi:MAG: hypothetical protein HYZ57_03985 [Acidobacteria bacterium]|nr:hypothetical protein [Acidobacteriota bacterium]MBI3278985.1 hypothetical protein [Acidobacteriota bacterium]
MYTSLALVHHANQYLITNGYDNREGLHALLGASGNGSGLAQVLNLHARYKLPFNLHISGTLLEAIAWHEPSFLKQVRTLLESGLVDLVGSCYGQNIMRFFGPEYNRKQLNEELRLYQVHLGIDPVKVKTFWPPERVWDTRRMAAVLRDDGLLNGGYRYVILDDRLLLSPDDPLLPRHEYDEKQPWSADLHRIWQIEGGRGLLVFPIGTRLRRSIPPGRQDDWMAVRSELEALLVQAADQGERNLLAVYADDMEKVSGIGEWGREGPQRFEAFLDWLSQNQWVRAVKLTEWAAQTKVAGTCKIETGTFEELANHFDAGEGYERWYLAPDWAPYRWYFQWAENRVRELVAQDADEALIALADKQLLVGNWETAWHTPPRGPHGDPERHGRASPWARALTSHSRQAAVTAEAAHWMRHKGTAPEIEIRDIDQDGEQELILKNQELFVVVTPGWGARVVAMFSVSGEQGAMVVGNPCDDWNWLEEMNRYMDVPRNHPGAFADVGFEHDRYTVECQRRDSEVVVARLRNVEEGSAARGLTKEFILEARRPWLAIRYSLPPGLRRLATEFGLSPDYLNLLRSGSQALQAIRRPGLRGFASDELGVWVRGGRGSDLRWQRPFQKFFGHGCMLRLASTRPEFEIHLGVSRGLAPARSSPVARRTPAEAAV